MGSLIAPSSFLNQKCADFNGTDEYMYRDDPSFKSDNAGGFSMWVRLDTLLGANGSRIIAGYGVNSGANDAMWSLRQFRNAGLPTTSNYFAVLVRATHAGTTNILAATTTTLSTGVWYHVVVETNGTTTSFYVNGVSQTVTVLVGTNAGTWLGDIAGTNHRLTVGCGWVANATNLPFPGDIDEITYLSGRVFTSGEVSSLNNSGTRTNPRKLASIQADLETWYRMGESRDSATTVFDEIGSNDLTLVNMDASNYVNV